MSWPSGVYAIKVDIDTRRGLEQGVPELMKRLAAHELRASFFMSWGPDNSGRALLKLLTNPRFLAKMLRTNAVATYGLRTALQGWLIPAPLIGAGRPDMAKELYCAGHEVEIHAWDHRLWQDTLARRDEWWVREWFAKAIAAHTDALGLPPSCFGAPAWMLSPVAVKVIAGMKLKYLSCTRAQRPFLLQGTGLLEIPGNIPCLEETGNYAAILSAAREAGGGVITLHAEVEGGPAVERFMPELITPLLAEGARVVTLGEMKRKLSKGDFEERPFELKRLPGRAEVCAV